MQSQFTRQTTFLVLILIVINLCVVGAEAQNRRKRRPRRTVRPVITNPVIIPATEGQTSRIGGEKIISTAEEAEETAQPAKDIKPKNSKRASDDSEIQQSINALSTQVNKLTDKLSQMQENDRSLLNMERLTRAEQRAEALRAQQVDVESKLADLQSRLEQTEYALKPENIERATATFGTTRPEEARESRRRQLESEKSRVQAQIRILETSRVRLESAIATADAEVDLLRRRLDLQRQQESPPPPTEPQQSQSREPQ